MVPPVLRHSRFYKPWLTDGPVIWLSLRTVQLCDVYECPERAVQVCWVTKNRISSYPSVRCPYHGFIELLWMTYDSVLIGR